MIEIVPREQPSRRLTAGVPLLAAIGSLLLAAIPLAFAGAPIIEAYGQMFTGVFGSLFSFTEMLTRATPLIFTGLAAAVAFRAKLWNIGGEGQLYLGAMAAVWVGSGMIEGPPILMVPLVLLAGAIAGGLGMLGPAVLKTRFGADEVVTSLLLNFIILIFVQMMLEGPLKDPMSLGWPQSEPIIDEAVLPQLIAKMRVHAGFLLAIGTAVVAHVIMAMTVWGLRIRAVGENAAAARHAGMPVKRIFLAVAFASGALAGIAGVSEVAGLKGYLTTDLSPGFGYTGIVVAMLAGLSPLGVVAAALFIASVFVGTDSMSRTMGVSSFLADLTVSMSLICVLLGGFFARFQIRRVRTEGAA
ncbi:nucleoside ABC transporter membrane protein [Aliiruegeria lutimaris]|uniref:Nucleoside ABC transporter membrane protein n=1 Tax=Aliiruegeria lutimaris TaxID=571298 RepID=A0A1G9DEJ1_9RHOB|nr:ABC transporter permease [Aliiruegeria lutimaris]SDK62269.1 nucleoside ABC transporter membrane protein [Aliiruegeria lutimaris]